MNGHFQFYVVSPDGRIATRHKTFDAAAKSLQQLLTCVSYGDIPVSGMRVVSKDEWSRGNFAAALAGGR